MNGDVSRWTRPRRASGTQVLRASGTQVLNARDLRFQRRELALGAAPALIASRLGFPEPAKLGLCGFHA